MALRNKIILGVASGLLLFVFAGIWDLLDAMPVPGPPGWAEGAGLSYCQALASSTQKISFWLLIPGWAMVLGSTLLAFSGSILGSTAPAEPHAGIWAALRGHRGLACTTLAVLLGSSGGYLLSRSNDSTLTARAATHAIVSATHDDASAYAACAHAKGLWLQGRANQQQLKDLATQLSQQTDAEGELPRTSPGILQETSVIEREDGETPVAHP